MSIRRPLLTLALAVTALLAIATPALARSIADGPFGSGDAFVVLTGRLDLPRGETVRDAIILNGDASIAGDVTSSVVALNGDVVVTGRVGKNVVALNGRVTVGPGARVGGDVVSRDPAAVASSATVRGRVRGVNGLNLGSGQFTIVGRFLVWVASTVSSFLVGLVLVLFAPRAADATAATAVRRLGASVGFGFLLLIGVPVAAFVAIVILVGIPLGLGVLLALGLFYWLGYTFGAYALGRRLVAAPTHRLLAFVAGWGILRGLALIPFVGGLVWLGATVWGLGAVAIAARSAGREAARPMAPAGAPAGGRATPHVPPVPPPPPPIPGRQS